MLGEDTSVRPRPVEHEDHDAGGRIIACLEGDAAGDSLEVAQAGLDVDRGRGLSIGDAGIPRPGSCPVEWWTLSGPT